MIRDAGFEVDGNPAYERERYEARRRAASPCRAAGRRCCARDRERDAPRRVAHGALSAHMAERGPPPLGAAARIMLSCTNEATRRPRA